MRWAFSGVVALGILLSGCAPERVDEAYRPRRTCSAYRHALSDMEIERADLGRRWLEASEQAVSVAETITLPFSETLVFDPEEPEAVALAFRTARDRTISIDLSPDPRPPLFFVDVYRFIDDGERVTIATLDHDAEGIVFRARRVATYVLRIQPELGRGGRIAVRVQQSRANPGRNQTF